LGWHLYVFAGPLDDSRTWYVSHTGEAQRGGDGVWTSLVYLDGPPGMRHRIRALLVDDAIAAELNRLINSQPGHALPCDVVHHSPYEAEPVTVMGGST
jgi:hypothetical protein